MKNSLCIKTGFVVLTITAAIVGSLFARGKFGSKAQTAAAVKPAIGGNLLSTGKLKTRGVVSRKLPL